MKNLIQKYLLTKTGILLIALILLSIFLILLGLLSIGSGTTAVKNPKTSPTPFAQQTNPVADQGRLDFEFSKDQLNFDRSHPWYNKIPPANNNYFIGYDTRNNSFFVELYPKRSSFVSVSDQVALLKTQVIDVLTSIGVNKVSSYRIDWQVYPK